MALAEAFAACGPLIEVLEELHVDYLLGGSFASSYHGTPRSTRDVDLVADLKLAHAPILARRLESRYYLDLERILEAVRKRSSFNLLYLETMFKVDVFVLKPEPFAREEMRRRQRVVIGQEQQVELASAEDTILQKLLWYRQSGDSSNRQWEDVLGVLKVCRGKLDLSYLETWAGRLGVGELLERAFSEGGYQTP